MKGSTTTAPEVLMRFQDDQIGPRMAAERFAEEMGAAAVTQVAGEYTTPQQTGRRMEWHGCFDVVYGEKTYRLDFDGREWVVSQ